MSVASYSVGTPVYNGGSSAATQGTVDPTGYINRSLIQSPQLANGGLPLTSDSQSRSGLAASAIQRLTAIANGVQTGQQGDLTNGQASGAGGLPVGGGVPNTGTSKPPVTGAINPTPTGSQVNTTPSGQVLLNLPFDQASADAQAQAMYKHNNDISQLGVQQNQIQQQAALLLHNLLFSQEQQQRGDLNNFGARGAVFSSGYGQQVANTADNYQNQFMNADQNASNGLQQINLQRSASDQLLNDTLTNIARALAEKQSANAGNLNLDPNFQAPAGDAYVTPPAPTPYTQIADPNRASAAGKPYVGKAYSATPKVAVDIPAKAGYDRQWSGYQWLYHPHVSK